MVKRGNKMLSRNTYVEIDLENIRTNVKNIINTHEGYQYYFGVVKADCYGHGNMQVVKKVTEGGCNYLAVATLGEAIIIRKEIKQVPVLCLGHISSEYIPTCKKENITVTIHSMEYLNELISQDCTNLRVHLKINTGMNRLGFSNKEEILKAIEMIHDNGMDLEGIFTHIYNASVERDYLMQINKMQKLISEIELSKIKIIHISTSEALFNYPKLKFVNGCRLGIAMYGFTTNKDLELKSTIKLISEVIQINELKKGETVGYNGTYVAKEDGEKIAVISIGYADGVIRKNTGRNVYINNMEYQIVGNICMDMLFVKIDDSVKIYDKVYILKDIKHIEEVAKHLDTIPYEIICSIGKRIPRICKQ